MVTRDLTSVFELMRNSAIKTRQINSEECTDPLLETSRQESSESLFQLPPAWTSPAEEFKTKAAGIRKHIFLMTKLQEQIINRPRLDDCKEVEEELERLTEQILGMFNMAHVSVKRVEADALAPDTTDKEQQLAKNVIASLVITLQSLTDQFRSLRSGYLDKLKSREAFLGVRAESSTENLGETLEDLDWLGRFSQQKQSVAKAKTDIFMEKARQKQIRSVVKCILDLSGLYKSLNRMIVAQGSILDRIDYNLETTLVEVAKGSKQLQKAAQTQKTSLKMLCIILLASVTSFMSALLIVTKL